MRFKLLCFGALLILQFSACTKKNSGNPTLENLNYYAQQIKINPKWIGGNAALFSILQSVSQPKDYTTVFQIQDSGTSSWKDLLISNPDDILLQSLMPKHQYKIRIKLSKESNVAYSAIDSFRCLNYFIDYEQFYKKLNASNYNHNNQIFAIEGARMIVPGYGFSSASTIPVRITALDNALQSWDITAIVLNDSQISITLPRILDQHPFVTHRFYTITIDQVPFIGYQHLLDNAFTQSALIDISNPSLQVNHVTVGAGTCSFISLDGYFGPSILSTQYPEWILDKNCKLVNKKLIWMNGVGHRQEILLKNDGTLNCDAYGIAAADYVQQHQAQPTFHEVIKINLRKTVSPGDYTLKVINTYADGSTDSSNAYSFSL